MLFKSLFRNFKIKNKIFFISSLLLFIFSLIGMITFNFFSNLYEKRIYNEATEVLKITSTILDAEINKIERLSFQTSTSDFIQRSLKSIYEDKFSYQAYQTQARLIAELENLATSEQYITSVQINGLNDTNYTAGYKIKIYSNLDDNNKLILNAQGASVWLNLGEENLLTTSRVIRDKGELSLQTLGILNITIDLDKLIATSLDFSSSKDFVIKNNDKIVYNKENISIVDGDFQVDPDQGYDIREISGEDYLIVHKPSRHSDLTYYNLLPYEDITQPTESYEKLMVLIFLLMFMLTISLSYHAAKGISKPLEELTEKMKKTQSGDLEYIVSMPSKQSHDEVDVLSRNFQTLLLEIDNLNKKNYQKQIMIQETEYKALQAQINPHFLYNTLDSINWLAQVNDQEKISAMTEALGNMMRNIISKKAPLISLKEELEIVNNYITIQKHRYYHRLEFSINESAIFEESSLPKLTIQPIVENAIQHGLEESIEPCHISVNIKNVENYLEIAIKDDGPGMDDKTIHSIYHNTVKRKGTGIGLFNIIERIRLMFGPEYGVDIESQLGKGTKVTIRLPFTKG